MRIPLLLDSVRWMGKILATQNPQDELLEVLPG
jgi:hypothetical protein